MIVSQAQIAMAEHDKELLAEKTRASSRLADRLRAKAKGQGLGPGQESGQGQGLEMSDSGENRGNNEDTGPGGLSEEGKAEKKIEGVSGGNGSGVNGGGISTTATGSDSSGVSIDDDNGEGTSSTICLARELWHILVPSAAMPASSPPSSSSTSSTHNNSPPHRSTSTL